MGGVKQIQLDESIRQGELGAPPKRCERFYQEENYWYYTTREGLNIGPFDSLELAKQGCTGFVQYINKIDSRVVEKLKQFI